MSHYILPKMTLTRRDEGCIYQVNSIRISKHGKLNHLNEITQKSKTTKILIGYRKRLTGRRAHLRTQMTFDLACGPQR